MPVSNYSCVCEICLVWCVVVQFGGSSAGRSFVEVSAGRRLLVFSLVFLCVFFWLLRVLKRLFFVGSVLFLRRRSGDGGDVDL